MPIPQSILERIATFGRNLDSYVDPDYKEARVRQEFIDPLATMTKMAAGKFIALLHRVQWRLTLSR